MHFMLEILTGCEGGVGLDLHILTPISEFILVLIPLDMQTLELMQHERLSLSAKLVERR